MRVATTLHVVMVRILLQKQSGECQGPKRASQRWICMNIRFEDVEDLHRRMRLWFGVCFLLTCGLSAFLIGCGAVLHNLPPWASVVAFSLLGGLMVVLAWQWLTLREANHDVRRGLSNLLFVDNLTKVFNSRYVMERLGFELKRAERRGQSLSVLYLDLNDFKSINDTLGHDAGDDVLEELGRLLRRCVRENDTLGRLGGDEFLMILPDTTVASARKLGERIKNITAGHVFRYRGKRIPRLAEYRASHLPSGRPRQGQVAYHGRQRHVRGQEAIQATPSRLHLHPVRWPAFGGTTGCVSRHPVRALPPLPLPRAPSGSLRRPCRRPEPYRACLRHPP